MSGSLTFFARQTSGGEHTLHQGASLVAEPKAGMQSSIAAYPFASLSLCWVLPATLQQ